MKRILTKLKTSAIMSGVGILSYSGLQLIGAALTDPSARGLASWGFLTVAGTVSPWLVGLLDKKKDPGD